MQATQSTTAVTIHPNNATLFAGFLVAVAAPMTMLTMVATTVIR